MEETEISLFSLGCLIIGMKYEKNKRLESHESFDVIRIWEKVL